MSANAIETLREHLPTDYLGPDPNDMDGEKWGQHPEALAALAAVEALLEAAKADLDYLSASVVGTSFVIPETTHALAAAVRRVETGQ